MIKLLQVKQFVVGKTISATASENTKITLNDGALIKTASGAGLTGTDIFAGNLTINSGEIKAAGDGKGTNVAKLNITLVDGSMNGGKITTASGDSLKIAFTDEDVKNNGQSVDKVFSLSSGEVVAKGDITLTGKGVFSLANSDKLTITSDSGKEANFVVSGADAQNATTLSLSKAALDNLAAKTIVAKGDITLTGKGVFSLANSDKLTITSDSGKEANFVVSGADAQNATTLSLSKAALDNLAAKTKIDTKNAVLDITGNDEIILGTNKNLTFAQTSAAKDQILAGAGTTLKAVNVKVDGAVTNASSVTVDATNLTLAGTAASTLAGLKAQNVTFEVPLLLMQQI